MFLHSYGPILRDFAMLVISFILWECTKKTFTKEPSVFSAHLPTVNTHTDYETAHEN
jgi:hypothetical protein